MLHSMIGIYLSILLFFSAQSAIVAQEPDVTYGKEYESRISAPVFPVEIKGDTLSFRIMYDDSGITAIGAGTYTLLKEFLIVELSRFNGIRSSYSVAQERSETFAMHVVDNSGKPLSGVKVLLLDETYYNETVAGTITDENGYCELENLQDGLIIKVVCVAHHPLVIDNLDSGTYEVVLVPYAVMDSGLLIFKLDSEFPGNRLSLVSLNNFEMSLGKRRNLRRIRKLDRRPKAYGGRFERNK